MILLVDEINYNNFMCVLKILCVFFKILKMNLDASVSLYFTNQQVAALQHRSCASCRLPRGELNLLFQPR